MAAIPKPGFRYHITPFVNNCMHIFYAQTSNNNQYNNICHSYWILILQALQNLICDGHKAIE